ncbi:MAG: histidinol-phosphate transaminase [Dethiobacteria bacterium]
MNGPKRRSCLELIKPYEPGKPVEEVERELGLTDVLKLASNENPLGPSPAALEALKEQLEQLHYYPDGNCYYLKKALAEKYRVTFEELIIGNGTDELLTLLTLAYINPGDEAVMVHPTFSEYEFALRLMGGIPRRVPLVGDEFSYDFAALAAAVNERTRLVFICSPNNPTGTIISREQLEEFMASLPSNVLVVLDHAYIEYVTDRSHPDGLDYIQQKRPLLVLRTFSKIYGLAGLRIGYALAPAPVIADLNRVREPFNVNTLAQVAAAAALEDRAHLARSLALVEKSRQQLAAGFKQMGLKAVPTGANFFFVDVKTDSRRLFQALLRRGIIIRSGDIFGYPTHIRVTCGTEEQNERFLNALAAEI